MRECGKGQLVSIFDAKVQIYCKLLEVDITYTLAAQNAAQHTGLGSLVYTQDLRAWSLTAPQERIHIAT